MQRLFRPSIVRLRVPRETTHLDSALRPIHSTRQRDVSRETTAGLAVCHAVPANQKQRCFYPYPTPRPKQAQFFVKRLCRNDQKQAGFPSYCDLDNPDQASSALLRTLRSPTPDPSTLRAHDRLRSTFDLQARSASRFVCRQNVRAARAPAHGTRYRNPWPTGWLVQEHLAGVVNTPHTDCWARGFLRFAECPGLAERVARQIRYTSKRHAHHEACNQSRWPRAMASNGNFRFT